MFFSGFSFQKFSFKSLLSCHFSFFSVLFLSIFLSGFGALGSKFGTLGALGGLKFGTWRALGGLNFG